MAEAATKAAGVIGEPVNRTHLPFELDKGVAHRAAIGLIVLATDNTLEYEVGRMLGLDGVAVYHSRVRNDPEITPETLARMERRIAEAAALILPGARLDVIAYACTSGAMVIGEDAVFARIREARPGIRCTTPITAAMAGFEALGIARVALLTPYVDDINQMMRRYIEARGVAVPAMGSFNHEDDNEVARITPASLEAATLELGRADDVDAVFVSCTSLRLVDFVDRLEAELGKPVLSSNHALAWHCLRLAGYVDPVPGFGRLMRV
ncbi:MAG: aspartate/glutamate racemase family protein [Alphaproteobacteria bacterium]